MRRPDGQYDDLGVSYGRALKDIDDRIIDMEGGRLSNAGEVTLAANAASTIVERYGVSSSDVLIFDPLTSNAAAELAAGTMFVAQANRAKGSFTITHANNAQTDRRFRFLFFAGPRT
jgi:hypothetical protein